MGTKKQNTEGAPGATTEKPRTPSKLYAMKAFKQASAKLIKLNMIIGEDRKHLDRINGNLLNAYLMSQENELDN